MAGGVTWREAIEAAIADAAGRPMTWGHDDCCLWVAGIVQRVAGLDPAAAWRPYTTPLGAARRLGTGGGLPAAITAAARRHGWSAVDADRALTGSIGVVRSSRRPWLGAAVIRLDDWWLGRDDNGVGFLPATACTHAWEVRCRPS